MSHTPSSVLTRDITVLSQPAIAARTSRLLVQLAAASFFALAGLGGSLMASRTLLRLEDTSRLWPMVANLASILLLLVCLGQWYVWHQAQKEWTGKQDVSLVHLLAPSAIGRWVAAACGIAGPLACERISAQTAPTDQAHWWALGAAVGMIFATAFGGIHQFDPAGPRGVLPARMPGARRVVTSGDDEHVDPHADTVVLEREDSGATAAPQ